MTVTVESKQLWKKRESHWEVWMSTQQWPHTQRQITWFDWTRQSAWLDPMTTPVDKKRVNYCVWKYFFFEGVQQQKKIAKKPRNAFSDALLLSRFRNFAKKQTTLRAVSWSRASCGFNEWIKSSINTRLKILKNCLRHWANAQLNHWTNLKWVVRT